MRLTNVYRLGLKELISLRYDPVLVFLIVYAFTFAIIAPARGVKLELENASVAVVDEDRSQLSARDDGDPAIALLPAAGADRPGRHRRGHGRRDLHLRHRPPAPPPGRCRRGAPPGGAGERGRHGHGHGGGRGALSGAGARRGTAVLPAGPPDRAVTSGVGGHPARLQPQRGIDLVPGGDADRQHGHPAGHRPHRGGPHPRARARHHRAPAGDAAHLRRDHARQGLGQRPGDPRSVPPSPWW